MEERHLTESDLFDWLSGEPEFPNREAFRTHLNSCRSCKERLAETSTIWKALNSDVEVPVELRERTLERILRPGPRRVAARTIKRSAAYLIAAIVLTLSSFFFLSRDVDFSRVSPGIIVGAAGVWVTLFILVLLMAVRKEDREWGIAARVGLGASMLFLIAIFLCPKTRYVLIWKQFMGAMVAEYFLTAWLIYFSLGIVYSLLPTFLMAVLFGRSSAQSPLSESLSSAVTFVLLLLPALYLQCAPLGLGVTLGWFGGSAAGALGGNLTGYGFHRHFLSMRKTQTFP